MANDREGKTLTNSYQSQSQPSLSLRDISPRGRVSFFFSTRKNRASLQAEMRGFYFTKVYLT